MIASSIARVSANVEHAALLLAVVGQSVGELEGVGVMDHDVAPLLPFHLVHGRQGHAIGRTSPFQGAIQPGLERVGIGMVRGERHQRIEIVGLRGAVHAVAVPVERRHGAGQSDAVAHEPESVGGRGRRVLAHGDDLGRELREALGVALGRHASGEASEAGEVTLLTRPLGDPGVQRSRRPAQRFAHRVGGPPPGCQTQPRESGSHRHPIEELRADGGAHRDTDFHQTDLHRSEHDVDPSEYGDVAGRHAAFDEIVDHSDGGVGGRFGGDRSPTSAVGAPGADRLGNPPPVVAQQPVGGGHDRRRTAVVDLERVVAGTREVPVEVDQPRRVGAVVAVDRLVVVAHAEHGEIGRRRAGGRGAGGRV